MFGSSGSVVSDMEVLLGRIAAGRLDTNLSVDAISGMAGAPDGLAALQDRTMAGKIVVYPCLHEVGLLSLAQLDGDFPTVASKLDDGHWCVEAERELLKLAGSQPPLPADDGHDYCTSSRAGGPEHVATPVEMPKLGNTVEQCLLVAWHKRKGDAVCAGDILAEMETDKATFDLTAPSDGTVLEVFFDDGAMVPVFTNVCVIGEAGEAIEEYRPKTPVPSATAGTASSSSSGNAPAAAAQPGKAVVAVSPPPDGGADSTSAIPWSDRAGPATQPAMPAPSTPCPSGA